MSWAAVGGAAVGVVGSMMTSDKKGGGAGSSTATKEPWEDAAPWLRDNIKTGQDLQAQYQQNPFNAQQLAAYGNMGRQTDYINRVIPDLLGQVSNQRMGFDRANPMARPTPYTFNGSGFMPGAQGGNQQAGSAQTGLLANLANPATVADPSSAAQYTSAANPPPPPPPPPPVAPAPSTFQAFDPGQMPLNDYARAVLGVGGSGGQPLAYNGGLGAFKYGDAMPQKGTQAYLDYQQYLMGAGDQLGMYAGGNSGNGGA